MTEQLATIGHNQAPDPIDETLAPYMDVIEEAEGWLDGTTVESEAQMKAVDTLIKELRSCKGQLAKAEKSATAPLHDAWKAEIARWRPTREDVERRLKGLAAVVDPFKRKLAEEKEAAKRKAYEEARAAERAAEEAARKANAASYDDQVEADRLAQEAMEAKKAASVANRDKVTGLRTVKESVVVDEVALARWLWQNDREAITQWQAERARKLGLDIPGVVEIRERKEAY